MSGFDTVKENRWIIKHQAKKADDFYGLESNKEIIWGLKQRHSYKGILLIGNSGSGKTSLGCYLLKNMRCHGNLSEPCGVCNSCREFQDFFTPPSVVFDGAWINNDERIRYVLDRASRPDFDLFIDNIDLSDRSLRIMLPGYMDHYRGGRLLLAACDLNLIPKPLQQRCLMIYLSYNQSSMIQFAKKICQKESIRIADEEAFGELVRLTNNNPRCLINVLEIIGLKGGIINRDICYDHDVLVNCISAGDNLKKQSKRRRRK